MNATYQTLVERVGHYLFGIRTGFSGDQTSDILDCIKDGLQRVYSAHEWSFFRPIAEVATTAPFTTGLVTVSSGVVTLVGGVFPAWAAVGVFRVNSRYYSISTRDSDTQVTLDSSSVNIASPSEFTLARPEIPMPAGFDGVANDSVLTHHPGAESWHPPVRPRHDQALRRLEQRSPEFGCPVFYSVRTLQFDPTIGSRKVLAFYPTPDQEYALRVPMVLRPIMLDGTNNMPIGGEMLSQVILEACLAAAEHNFEEREHVHEKRFMEAITLAIKNDQERSSVTELGPDSPRVTYGKFSVVDYDYSARQQRIGQISLGGDVL